MDSIDDRNFGRDWHGKRFILKLLFFHCPPKQCHFKILLIYSIVISLYSCVVISFWIIGLSCNEAENTIVLFSLSLQFTAHICP